MSKTTRTGIEILANTIGRSKNKIKDSFGDLTKRRGFNLKAESTFTRIKTSNTFHDYDLASKSTDGYSDPEFLTYDVEDPIGGVRNVIPGMGNYKSDSYTDPCSL